MRGGGEGVGLDEGAWSSPPVCRAVSIDLWGGRGGGVKGEEEPIGCRFEERGWGLRGGGGKGRSWANRKWLRKEGGA